MIRRVHITQSQYTVLVRVAIRSVVVPTLIADKFFLPARGASGTSRNLTKLTPCNVLVVK